MRHGGACAVRAGTNGDGHGEGGVGYLPRRVQHGVGPVLVLVLLVLVLLLECCHSHGVVAREGQTPAHRLRLHCLRLRVHGASRVVGAHALHRRHAGLVRGVHSVCLGLRMGPELLVGVLLRLLLLLLHRVHARCWMHAMG